MPFTFTPQNFIDQKGPDISAAWLNGIDLTVNNGLQGLTTTAAIAALLGSSIVTFPIAVNQGGTGSTTAATGLQALGGVASTPQTAGEFAAGFAPSAAQQQFPPLTPGRYGFVAGTADNHAAFATFAAVVNATTNPVAMWFDGLTYQTSQAIPTITAANFVWHGTSTIGQLFNIPTTPNTAALFSVSGSNCWVRGLTFNGNQNVGIWSGTGLNGIWIQGNNAFLDYVTVVNTPGSGVTVNPIIPPSYPVASLLTGFRMKNSFINNNAAWGFQLNYTTGFEINGNQINANGYGLQVYSQPANAGVSMGMSIRFRSTRGIVTNNVCTNNGLDGLNINDGSYGIRLSDNFVGMNGDAGITIAADIAADGTGQPGQYERCYDIWVDDTNTTWNNWGGGLVAETTVYNCMLKGRHYNNNRGAGTIAFVASQCNGIYVATGSLGVQVDATCYDDRQLCPITAATSGGVITATGWGTTANWGVPLVSPDFTPTAGNYPRVVILGADFSFQGYGNITAESAGSVTITPAANNPCVLATIVTNQSNGWFISQRVQHNGLYWAPSAQGTYRVKGRGYTTGPNATCGHKVYIYSANGTNVLNLEPAYTSQELLANPSWDLGTSSGWSYSANGTIASITNPGSNLHSAVALQLVNNNAPTPITGTGALATVGSIATVGALAGTATSGTYPNVSLTGGSGSTAAATVVITGGTVSAITITTAGIGYAVGDTLGWNVTGGSGTCHVATLNTTAQFAQDGIAVARCKVTAAGLGGSITLTNVSDGFSTTVNHPGGGTVDLIMGVPMPAGSSPSFVVSANGDATVVFDEASLKMTFDGIDNTDFYNAWPTRNLAT